MRSLSSRPTSLIRCACSATRSWRHPYLDGPEQREQGRRRGEHDTLRQRPFDQPRFTLGSGGEKRIVRNEEHDELGALLELAGVATLGELLHVRPHLLEMLVERHLARFVVGRLDGIEIGGERHLRVDDDHATGRHADDDVGTEAPGFGRDDLLLHEVTERRHARELGNPSERNLAPSPAHVRRPEREHEARRLVPQRGVGGGDVAELFANGAELALPALFGVAGFALVDVERLLQRRHQSLDRGAAGVEIAGRLLAQRLELLLGELQEIPGRGGQGVGREGPERVRQA